MKPVGEDIILPRNKSPPHKRGCRITSLREVASLLRKRREAPTPTGSDEILNIVPRPIIGRGCGQLSARVFRAPSLTRRGGCDRMKAANREVRYESFF